MKHAKKFSYKQMIQEVVPYIVVFGIGIAIYLIGFAFGRMSIPSAALEKQDVTSTTCSMTESSTPAIETTIPETSVPEEKWIDFTATAYCPCEKCCGEYASGRPLDEDGKPIVRGATGIVLQQGISVAADTSIHPMGTQLEIESLGTYTVQDRGSAIKGNRLDIYFENHDDAVKFGKQIVRVRVEK